MKQVVLETPLDNGGAVSVCCNATTLDEILAQTTEEGGVTQSPKAPLSVTEVRSRSTKGLSVCAVMLPH